MRSMLLATIATVGLTLGGAAIAQTTNDNMAPPSGNMPTGHVSGGHIPGVGPSQPASANASNISSSDTRSTIAPRLPGSDAAGMGTTVGQELRMAQAALSQHRTGAAQEALERAETRLLDRSTPAGMTGMPDPAPTVATISQARAALGHHDVAGAQTLITEAMTQTAG